MFIEKENQKEQEKEMNLIKFTYNPEIDLESNECYMIRRQIKMTERDAANLKDLICQTRKEMRDMIAAKDVFYNTVRAMRKKQSENAGDVSTIENA